jgi:hypothetical protein
MKLVREYINEKFTQESDPIEDMGIGGYSFETLKPGAVIKSKRIGIAVTLNRSGQFTSWLYGMQLHPEIFILICKINPYGSDRYKDIIFRKYYHLEVLENAKKELKHGEITTFTLRGPQGRMIVSKKMFDNRFEIIERGF